MECPVCLEGYTSDTNLLPKLTPCGHLACVGCLRRVQQCPKCRKEFTGSADALPTVFDNIGGRERADGLSGWWCTECLSPAAAQCRAKHPIIRVEEALRRQAAKLAPLASEAVRGLEDAVQAAAEEPARLALQLLADGDAPAECELTVRRGGSAVGAQWRLEEGGAASGLMARTLLCQLAAEGTLQDKPAAQAPPQAAAVLEAPIVPEVAVYNISWKERQEILQRVRRHGVLRIKDLFILDNSMWSLLLLQAATVTLEELSLYLPQPEHLQAALAAPRLRRLFVHGLDGTVKMDGQPLVLPALDAPNSLQWLGAGGLPMATLQSLLRAHAASLRTLVLSVGSLEDKDWPDLDAMLLGCGLAALKKLQLDRPYDKHDETSCGLQIQALRRALPATAVQCLSCDNVEREEF